MRHLIERKCDLFPQTAKDLVFDPDLLSELIVHLQLKLYKNFQYYNFYDILISLSQMFLTSLASRECEIHDILNDFNEVNKNSDFSAEVLEDVIDHIEEIQAEKNVQICKKLDKSLIKFKSSVLDKIDCFEGNIYTSSMLPTVLRI